MTTARMLVVSQGLIVERRDIASVEALSGFEPRRPKNFRERQSVFDAATYDRMRVLVTELRRIHDDGGDIALRVGTHAFIGARLANWMLAV